MEMKIINSRRSFSESVSNPIVKDYATSASDASHNSGLENYSTDEDLDLDTRDHIDFDDVYYTSERYPKNRASYKFSENHLMTNEKNML